jgi:hypothetical protein
MASKGRNFSRGSVGWGGSAAINKHAVTLGGGFHRKCDPEAGGATGPIVPPTSPSKRVSNIDARGLKLAGGKDQ